MEQVGGYELNLLQICDKIWFQTCISFLSVDTVYVTFAQLQHNVETKCTITTGSRLLLRYVNLA